MCPGKKFVQIIIFEESQLFFETWRKSIILAKMCPKLWAQTKIIDFLQVSKNN